MHPPRPGGTLLAEFLGSWGMSVGWLAKALHVEATHLRRIAAGQRRITPRMALLLARYSGTSPRIWIDSGAEAALRTAERSPRIMRQIARVEPLVPCAAAPANHEVIGGCD